MSNTGRKESIIYIQTKVNGQDAGGGNTVTSVSEYKMWADIENRDGRLITSEGQRQWPYNYKITVRYETSRPITTKQTVRYEGVILAINSVTRVREGMRWENILRCSTV